MYRYLYIVYRVHRFTRTGYLCMYLPRMYLCTVYMYKYYQGTMQESLHICTQARTARRHTHSQQRAYSYSTRKEGDASRVRGTCIVHVHHVARYYVYEVPQYWYEVRGTSYLVPRTMYIVYYVTLHHYSLITNYVALLHITQVTTGTIDDHTQHTIYRH